MYVIVLVLLWQLIYHIKKVSYSYWNLHDIFYNSFIILTSEVNIYYKRLLCQKLGCCHGGTCSTPLGTDRNPSNSGGLYKQKQRLLPFRNSLRHTICADQSCSGAISLYPFPWMLMISIDGSSFKCLRNLVIYTSILLALK